jgi:hypothetical protein
VAAIDFNIASGFSGKVGFRGALVSALLSASADGNRRTYSREIQVNKQPVLME